jgi:hypothetical protein
MEWHVKYVSEGPDSVPSSDKERTKETENIVSGEFHLSSSRFRNKCINAIKLILKQYHPTRGQ